MDLKQLAKKYDVSTNDFDCVYYDVFNKVKKFGENFDDLFGKFLYDKLEEFNMESRDIDNLVNHYTKIMEDYCNRKSTVVNKMLEGESVQQIMDEEMQTSGFVNNATEGRRKAGYKVVVQDEYDEQEDEENNEKFEDL